MKRLVAAFYLVFILSPLLAQTYKTNKTFVQFYSSTPIEDIKATNEDVKSLVNVEDQTIAIIVPIKSFEFRKKLMQEHFNENYLESDKYPKAIFKGTITNWDGSYGTFKAKAVGTMTMHGVTKDVEIEGDLSYEEGSLMLESVFIIRLEDYEIDIPTAVFYKIAEEVEVTTKLEYAIYEEK
jgi:polyisoprenoid-binding protein YceI